MAQNARELREYEDRVERFRRTSGELETVIKNTERLRAMITAQLYARPESALAPGRADEIDFGRRARMLGDLLEEIARLLEGPAADGDGLR
jgi:hypothetical protein